MPRLGTQLVVAPRRRHHAGTPLAETLEARLLLSANPANPNRDGSTAVVRAPALEASYSANSATWVQGDFGGDGAVHTEGRTPYSFGYRSGGVVWQWNGSLRIVGTSEADDIRLSVSNSQLVVTMNGEAQTIGRLSDIPPIHIDARAGDDSVWIGPGVMGCTISGGAGNDTISAGDGNDLIYGQNGDDSLTGGAGADTIYGDEGFDRAEDGGSIFAQDWAKASARASGSDAATAVSTTYGGAGQDTIAGGAGGDLLYGDAGHDCISGDASADTIYGGDGSDTIDAGKGPDSINGGNQGDRILGALGNDTLAGGKGHDTIDGGDGDDSLTGGLGRDLLMGGPGNNRFTCVDGSPDTLDGSSSLADAADYILPRAWVDESSYRQTYPDVAAAIDQGIFASAYEHFALHGLTEGRNPSSYFDETYYRDHNPDVTAAIATGAVHSGFQHYLLWGQQEQRDPSPLFDESWYLTQYPDVAAAVAGGALRSGFEHLMLYGHSEGRLPLPSVAS